MTDFSASLAGRRLAPWPVPPLDGVPPHPDQYQVIVIGAGIGGLSAAALLAARGCRVLVLEAHRTVGGNCVSWQRAVTVDGRKLRFVFDSGVQDISGLGPRGPLRNLLRQLKALDRLVWHPVRHAYCKEGMWLDGAQGVPRFIENYCCLFPDEAANIRAFFAEMAAIYHDMYAEVDQTGGVPVPPAAAGVMAWAARHPHAFGWMKQPFDDMLAAYFTSEPLKQMLRTVSEYITDDPHLLLVEDMAPLFGYYFDGGCYPGGGAQQLANLLADLFQARGGTLKCRQPVARILTACGQAVGVETKDGQIFHAPVIISNADAVATLTQLADPALLPKHYRTNLMAMGRGPSAFLLSLGLSTVMDVPERIFVKQNGLEFGIGNPGVHDATLASPGYSAVTLLCLLSEGASQPWLTRGPGYDADKRAFADRLIDAAATAVMPDLRRHIVYREAATPASFAAYTGALGGNIYGAARGGWRPSLRSPLPGLFLVGGGTEAGAGIEAVVVSATRAADTICPPLKARILQLPENDRGVDATEGKIVRHQIFGV
ncbi:MAG: NAD(P)/FAD-dependent oxidoreductase [Rhizomicrobium sp.]